MLRSLEQPRPQVQRIPCLQSQVPLIQVQLPLHYLPQVVLLLFAPQLVQQARHPIQHIPPLQPPMFHHPLNSAQSRHDPRHVQYLQPPPQLQGIFPQPLRLGSRPPQPHPRVQRIPFQQHGVQPLGPPLVLQLEHPLSRLQLQFLLPPLHVQPPQPSRPQLGYLLLMQLPPLWDRQHPHPQPGVQQIPSRQSRVSPL